MIVSVWPLHCADTHITPSTHAIQSFIICMVMVVCGPLANFVNVCLWGLLIMIIKYTRGVCVCVYTVCTRFFSPLSDTYTIIVR